MKHRALAASLFSAFLIAANPLPAQTITFDGLALSNGAPFSSWNESGFSVQLANGIICAGQQFGNPVPSLFGGPICSSESSTSVLLFTRDGGGTFNFLGADLIQQNGQSTYLFEGFFGGAGAFAHGNNIPGEFTFVANPSNEILIDQLFITLNSITSTSFNIDNISFGGADTTVPEPATMSLLALGLAGLGAARRRRQ